MMEQSEYTEIGNELDHKPREDANSFTVAEAVNQIGFGKFQIKVFFLAGLLMMTDAMELLTISIVNPTLRCEWQISEWEVALITTVVFIGNLIGGVMWGIFADKYGRKSISIIASVLVGYFGIIQSNSPNLVWMLILRFTVGFGFGGSMQALNIITEYMPVSSRGKILLAVDIWWSFGGMMVVLLGFGMLPGDWRWFLNVTAIPTFISVIGFYCIPESARYLVAAGRHQEALKVIEEIAKTNGKEVPRGTLVGGKEEHRGDVKDLFSSSHVKTTLLMIPLWIIPSMTYYGVILLSSSLYEFGNYCGADNVSLNLRWLEQHTVCNCFPYSTLDYISILVSAAGELFGVPLSILLIDSLGRTHTLALVYFLAAIAFLCLQLCTTRIWLTFLVFCVRMFIPDHLTIIYTMEVYPTTIRSTALGLLVSISRVGAILTPFLAQVLGQHSKIIVIWIYSALCILGAVISFFLPIETKGRDLMQH